MTASAVSNLRLALNQLLREMSELPPFSQQRKDLHGDAELLRGLIRRLEHRQAA